jgi:acetyl-CoA acetyltransferase
VGSLARTAAIVGVAESDEIGYVPEKSALQHHAEAAHNALADAGLNKSDVDALFTAGPSTLVIGEYLGINPTYTDSTSVGGSSFVMHVRHAVSAIANGLCEVALVTHGQTGHSNRGAGRAADGFNLAAAYEAPYGVIGPPISYSLAAMRHMAQYGTTSEQLAQIAVSTRQWAILNPKALMREPLTVEDVLNSRLISYPFHLLDCCLVTDAGAAVVVTSAARARDCRKPPVWILGAAEYHDHSMISQMPDLTVTPASVTGPAALAEAGVAHEDIDVLELYDSFTYTVLVTLEDLGFCRKGEGGPFVADGKLGPGGSLPTNTNGGGLSYTHPGMYGIFTLVEAVRQLRGEAGERQVEDCRIALCHGMGGSLSSSCTMILARD